MVENFGAGYLNELNYLAEQKGLLVLAGNRKKSRELEAQVFTPPLELKIEVDKDKCRSLKNYILDATIHRNHINISPSDFVEIKISPDCAVEYVDMACTELNQDDLKHKFKYTRIGLGVQIIKEEL